MPNYYGHQSIIAAFMVLALASCGTTTNEAPTNSATGSAKTSKTHVLEKSDVDGASISSGHCSLDVINGQVLSDDLTSATIRSGQDLTAVGWILTTALKVPTNLTFVLQGTDGSSIYGIDGVTSLARPDVAKVFKLDGTSTPGFGIAGGLSEVPAGKYEMLILTKNSNKPERCDTRRQLIIKS